MSTEKKPRRFTVSIDLSGGAELPLAEAFDPAALAELVRVLAAADAPSYSKITVTILPQ